MADRRGDAVGRLVEALYGLSPIRRELQRLAGVEHAVAAVSVLSILARSEAIRISDIADALQVDLSVASRHLHALEEKGYVERIADPEDGRSSLVKLSSAGREKLEAAHRRLADGLAEALAGWEPAEVSALAEGLARLHATLGHPAPEPAFDGLAIAGDGRKKPIR
ncbi:MAG: MarR family winged helix-turn-helix transcriptional regulator [Solirubrobacterales bacterium]